MGKALLIDAGNTRLKCWQLLDGVVTQKLIFGSETLSEAAPFFAENRWDNVLICNTGQSDQDLRNHFVYSPVQFIGPESLPGFRWAYSQPENLGKDRIAALIGANKLMPKKNICVADAGTCLTLDAMDFSGNHLGGTISPGLKMRLSAMHEKTKNLPLSSEKEAFNSRGNTTLSCLAAGAVWGMVAEIEFQFNQIEKDGFSDPILFLTGGDAEILAHRLKVPNFVSTDLVFQGMIAVLASLE